MFAVVVDVVVLENIVRNTRLDQQESMVLVQLY